MHTDIDFGVLLVGLERIVNENSDTPLSDICKKFKNVKREVSFDSCSIFILFLLELKF